MAKRGTGEGGKAKPAGAQPRAVEPEAADGEDLTFLDWSYRLLKLERIQAEAEDEDGQDIFAATFQVDGPNANAEVEIIVSDFTDEAHVVSIAQHILHVAATMWGRVTADRLIADRAKDLPD